MVIIRMTDGDLRRAIRTYREILSLARTDVTCDIQGADPSNALRRDGNGGINLYWNGGSL